jgi:Holliday junction resolvase
VVCQAGSGESTKHQDPIVAYKADVLLEVKVQDTKDNRVLWHTKSKTSIAVKYSPVTDSNALNIRQSKD